MSSTKSVKLLICSGNLGNAEPDVDSLSSWVPEDGLCFQVTDNQKYPVVVKKEEFSRGDQKDDDEEHSNGEDKYKEDEEEARKLEKFDLIVLGMQESTFEPIDEEAEAAMAELIKSKLEQKEDSAKDDSAKDDIAKDKDDDDDSATDGDAELRKSDVLTDSVQHVSRQVSKQASKAKKHATKHAKKAAKTSVQRVSQATDKAEKAAMKGVSAVNTLTASRDNTKDTAEMFADGTAVLHELLQDRLPSYTRLLSYQRGEMRLLVYSLNANHSVQLKSVRAQNTGMAGLANKGGIVAEVVVDRGTVFSFMTCHLEAHEGLDKYARRCASLGEILNGTRKFAVPSIYPDASLATHFCFVMGDLNFRTRYNGRIKYNEQIDDVNKLVLRKRWKELNECDELRMALDKHECLHGFSTLYCNFPPTFKVERGDGYVYKSNRTPSYTDRILWRAGDLLDKRIAPLAYEPIDKFTTSDHKPIRGAFEVMLNRGVAVRKRQNLRSSIFAWKTQEQEQRPDNVHVFVEGIQADIFRNSEGSAPDTYVCLVSSPEDIILKKPTKCKQCYNAMAKFLKISNSYVGVDIDSAEASPSGWPRTRVMKDNHNPAWTNQEIHCQLKPNRKDGFPINLSGAILHIFVFKYNSRQTDEVIGSYPINLETIFRRCTKPGLGGSIRERSWRRNMSQSIRGMVLGGKNESTLRDSNENMISIDIDGPLLKNGKQTGRLRCTVDAWLVDNALAAASVGGASVKDPTHYDGASVAGSEGSHPMFSSRHLPSKKSSRRLLKSNI